MQGELFMTAKKYWAISVCIPLSLLLSAAVLAAERTFDKKFSVTSGGTLTLSTHTGAVTIAGSDTNEVVVHAVLRGDRELVEDFELTAEAVPSGVSVIGRRFTNNWFNLAWLFGGGLNVRYTIQIPRDYRVDVRTSGGDLNIKDFNGQTQGRTSGGNVWISAIRGDIDVRTSGGNVTATQLVGEVHATTSGGNIQIDKVQGNVNAQTSGGDVRLSHIDGPLHARTSGGDVDVDVTGANRGVDLRTSGGDVIVTVQKEFAADVDLRTSGGDVDCELPVRSSGERDRHRRTLRGETNGGGSPLSVRTSGGDIEIRART
jgi:Putative adhesin